MLNVMEDRDVSVTSLLRNITDTKTHPDGTSSKYKEASESVTSYEDLKSLQNTKKVLQKKSQLHPLFANHPYRCPSMYCPRASTSQPKLKDVSQRIVSAKILQVKELRNKLSLTQHQLNEVINENKFLKTLQKRQEVALSKYEGHEARLPQLIQSHNEEVRILTSKLKQMKQTNQRLVEKLKGAEQQLSNLQEEHFHLLSLSRNQQLGEREMLALKVQELQHTVREQNNTIQLLTRKVDLERKNYKHELGTEKGKRSEMERKLALAMQTIENLKDQIEAKEKCMNAIVPSRYVRTIQSQSQPTLQSSRPTHSQFPRTPHGPTYKNNVNQPPTTRRSSTDQTSNETDNPESQNENNTSDSNRTISGMTLPMIKPQITNRNLRNQYKFPSKRVISNEKSPNNIDTGDYSSSLTSVENSSFKDLMKNSESESEKLSEPKRQLTLNPQAFPSRGRKFSVDSGVTNKSDENSKSTERTESTISSSKTRRNSISVCPSAENLDNFLQQDSLALRIETHKSIKDELKILEEKLLQGSQFLVKAKKQKSVGIMAEDTVKEVNTSLSFSLKDTSDKNSDDEATENFSNVNWNEIHNKMKAESEAAEAKLEEYYNSLENSELNLEDTEKFIALEEEQKEKLLKALKQIDKEAQGVSSSSSSQDESKASSNRKPNRRKSDVHRNSISKNIDNLHRGRPVYDSVKIPVIEKMKKEEKEYLSDAESAKKSKADFMKDLFGDYEGVTEHKNTFSSSERRNEDLDRLVLSRSFD